MLCVRRSPRIRSHSTGSPNRAEPFSISTCQVSAGAGCPLPTAPPKSPSVPVTALPPPLPPPSPAPVPAQLCSRPAPAHQGPVGQQSGCPHPCPVGSYPADSWGAERGLQMSHPMPSPWGQEGHPEQGLKRRCPWLCLDALTLLCLEAVSKSPRVKPGPQAPPHSAGTPIPLLQTHPVPRWSSTRSLLSPTMPCPSLPMAPVGPWMGQSQALQPGGCGHPTPSTLRVSPEGLLAGDREQPVTATGLGAGTGAAPSPAQCREGPGAPQGEAEVPWVLS